MVLDDELHKPVEEMLRLLFRETMDALHMMADGEDGFPTGNRVCADDRVDSLEDFADILRGTAF